MDNNILENILKGVKDGKLSIKEALQEFKEFPFASLDDDIKLDTHRALRKGFPEVIFGEGKSPSQILTIVRKLDEMKCTVLVTRTNKDVFLKISSHFDKAVFNEAARTITLNPGNSKPCSGNIAIATGGTTDIPVAEEAAVTAEIMGCNVSKIYDAGVAGIHRLLMNRELLKDANVVIAVAGMEGALPSVIGGLVDVPVIAVPTSVGYGASFGGISALLAMLNSCAAGVVTVNIDNGFGAGYVAAQIVRKK